VPERDAGPEDLRYGGGEIPGVPGTLPTHGATDARETAKELLMETIRDVLGEDPPVLVHPQV
jgi:hypothetical protein